MVPINLGIALDGWADRIGAMIQGGELTEFEEYSLTAEQAAGYVLTLYREYLNGAMLPNGTAIQHPTGELAKAASLDARGFLDFHLMNSASHAEAVEKGTKERDMKEMLPTARKARRAADGSLYLIIPFRHSTPGASATGMHPMPARVWQMAQQLTRSRVTGHRNELGVTPFIGPKEMVKRLTYKWGQALSSHQLAGLGLSFREQNRFQGMYKFGEKGHSQYITFRVLSQKSKGWILPARPGVFAAKAAMEESDKKMAPFFAEALQIDLLRIAGLA